MHAQIAVCIPREYSRRHIVVRLYVSRVMESVSGQYRAPFFLTFGKYILKHVCADNL